MSEAAQPHHGLSPRLSVASQIIEAVATVYGIAESDITGRLRTKAIAEARCCVYLIAKRCTRLSYTEIATVLGRDHTTVMAGVKSAERMRARDAWLAATVAELLEQFGEIDGEVMQ